LDTAKADKELGFKVKRNSEEGMKRMIEWYKENMYLRKFA